MSAIVPIQAYRRSEHASSLPETARKIGLARVSINAKAGPSMNLVGRGGYRGGHASLISLISLISLAAALCGSDGAVRESGREYPVDVLAIQRWLDRCREFRPKDAILSAPAGASSSPTLAG